MRLVGSASHLRLSVRKRCFFRTGATDANRNTATHVSTYEDAHAVVDEQRTVQDCAHESDE